MEEQQKRVKIIVSGLVQGVFFRAHTQEEAQSLHLKGYVRNLITGDVEITAEGNELAVNKLIEWSKHGPPMASVTNVQVTYEVSQHNFSSFSIRY